MRLELTQFGALAILFGLLVLGEIIAKVTKGKVPGALVISVLMIVGFWTILPLDIVERAGITSLTYAMCAMIIVTNLATLISRKEMMAQWRTVVVNLMGIAAICLFVLTIGSKLFGSDYAVAATPPLTGGAIATMLMVEAASGKGKMVAALVALITMVMQGLVGYPLTNVFLGREAKRLGKLHKEGKLGAADGTAVVVQEAEKQSIFTKIKSPAFILLKLVLVALASYWIEIFISNISGGTVLISRYVWCLVLGFLASEFKFLEKDALAQSKSDGILMNLLLIYLFGGLNAATPENFLPVAGLTLALVLIASVGMALMAFIASKIFKKESFSMCYSIILTAFYGFPINVMLTDEAVEAASDDKATREAIRAQILPKMLVGGFTSVTVVSVLVAGILVNYL